MVARRSNRTHIETNRRFTPVGKSVISKTVLDVLIRTRLSNAAECAGVEAMPVAQVQRGPNGCNWVVPGWVGDISAVERCKDKIDHYISFLARHFDIPDGA